MKQLELSLSAPQLQNPADQANMAAFVSQLNELLKYIADNLGGVKVLTSAPTASELSIVGDGRGNVISEVAILDDGTQTNRKLYYLNSAKTLRLIDSA